MSVIRKYKTGGKTPISWEDFAAKEMKGMKFSKDAEPHAQESLMKFRELAEGEGDNIHNVFNIDPISNTYTVDVDKMKNPELKAKGAAYWTGTEGKVKTNIFGKFTTKDIKGEEDSGENKFMGVGAGLFGKWLKGNAPTESEAKTEPTSKGNIGLYDLPDYMTENKIYPDIETFQKDKTNEERQSELKQIAIQSINEYLANAEAKPGYTHTDLEAAQKLKEILENPNSTWEEFTKASYKVGWNPDKLLTSSEELEVQAQADKIAADQQTQSDLLLKRENFGKNLLEQGYNPGYVSNLATQGYENIYDYTNLPENFAGTDLSQIMQNKDLRLITNQYGKSSKLISLNEPGGYSHYYNKPTSKNFGQYWGYDPQGNLKRFKQGDEGYQGDIFTQHIQDGKPTWMSATVNGKKVQVAGIPTSEGDHLTRLWVPMGDETREVEKQSDGTYKDVKTGSILNIDIESYIPVPEGQPAPSYFDEMGKSIRENSDIFKDIGETKTDKSVEEIVIKEGKTVDFARALSQLKYLINNSPSYTERVKATTEYEKIMDHYKDDPKKLNIAYSKLKKAQDGSSGFIDFFTKSPYSSVKSLVKSQKRGGKFQFGGKYTLSPDEYLSKYKATEETGTESSTINDISGTLRGMSDLDKASLITSGISVLPVVGAAGAAATTILDVASDLESEGKVDWWNLALNLGFTGLSLVGAGGVGAAARAGKLAAKGIKTADQIADISKIASKFKTVDEIKKLTKSVEKLSKLKSGTYKAAGIAKNELSILKKANLVNPKASVSTIAKKHSGEKALSFIKDIKPNLIPEVKTASALQREFSGTIKTAKVVGDALKGSPKVAKAVKVGVAIPMVVGAGSSAITAAQDWSEGGFGNIQSKDFKNLVLATAGARSIIKSKQLAKNMTSVLDKAKGSKKYLSMGGKKVEITKDIEIPKVIKPEILKKFSPTAKAKALKENQRATIKFKKKIEETVGKENLPDNFDDLIREKDLSKVFKVIDQKGSELPGLAKSGLNKQDYDRAIAALSKKGLPMGYGLPSWNVKSKKKGGTLIPKFQKPFAPLPVNNQYDYSFGKTPIITIPAKTNTLKQEKAIMNVLPTVTAYGKKSVEPNPYKAMETTDVDPVTKKKVNLGDATSWINAAIYGKGKFTNAKIARLMQKANLEGLVQEPMMKRTNIPTSSYSGFLFDKEAAKVDAMGRRIAESTSNFDQSLKARLAASEQSGKTRLQGKLKDVAMVNDLRREQLTSDQNTDRYNLGVIGRNKQRSAEVLSQIPKIEANKQASDYTSFMNYLTMENEGIKQRRLENKMNDRSKLLLDNISDPEYKQAIEDYKKYEATDYLEKAKQKAIAEAGQGNQNFDWENSDIYKNAITEKRLAGENIINLRNKRNAISSIIMQYPNLNKDDVLSYSDKLASMYKSGGSLSDKLKLEDRKSTNKMKLENLKNNQKKEIAEMKEALKSISENNKFLQKSLLKIFN